jgi:hypothetical protein
MNLRCGSDSSEAAACSLSAKRWRPSERADYRVQANAALRVPLVNDAAVRVLMAGCRSLDSTRFGFTLI